MNYRSLLIVCLATLGLAVAGWGQADGKIAFISDRDGHGDVWVMNADGSIPVNLTQGRDCTSPAWSPDGTQIAYIADGEVWLMAADGSNPQQVTDDAVDKTRLWWSEDGRSIYYAAVKTGPLDRSNGPETFVTALDGSGSAPVDWREVYDRFLPGVSPDGTVHAWLTLIDQNEDEEGLIYAYFNFFSYDGHDDHRHPGLLLPESRQNKDIYGEPYDHWRTFPTWSSDGVSIAFAGFLDVIGQFDIWAADVAEADEQGRIKLTDLTNLTNGLGGREPAWQPISPAATSVEAQSWGRIKALLSH